MVWGVLHWEEKSFSREYFQTEGSLIEKEAKKKKNIYIYIYIYHNNLEINLSYKPLIF